MTKNGIVLNLSIYAFVLNKWRNKLDDNLYVGVVLMDFSKAFDYIPHDLIITKITLYGIQNEILSLLFYYFTNRKQCIKIKYTYSTFKAIISDTPQGSILGPLFFN